MNFQDCFFKRKLQTKFSRFSYKDFIAKYIII